MTFDYLNESEIKPVHKVALLGMGSLALMKLRDADGEYRPAADELVCDLEAFLKDAVNDPGKDPDDPIVPNMMSKLYGFSFVWSCGYRWAKNPSGLAYAADVVVSSDGRHYLNPLELILAFMKSEKPSLSRLLIDAYCGNVHGCNTATQISTEN